MTSDRDQHRDRQPRDEPGRSFAAEDAEDQQRHRGADEHDFRQRRREVGKREGSAFNRLSAGPAKAGTPVGAPASLKRIPAFAGMTALGGIGARPAVVWRRPRDECSTEARIGARNELG